MGALKMIEGGAICCFCKENIKSDHVNPCNLNILTNWDKLPDRQDDQDFWCHAQCFEEKLHPQLRSYFVVQLFSEEE